MSPNQKGIVLSLAIYHTDFIETPAIRRVLLTSDFSLEDAAQCPFGAGNRPFLYLVSIDLCHPCRTRFHCIWPRMPGKKGAHSRTHKADAHARAPRRDDVNVDITGILKLAQIALHGAAAAAHGLPDVCNRADHQQKKLIFTRHVKLITVQHNKPNNAQHSGRRRSKGPCRS